MQPATSQPLPQQPVPIDPAEGVPAASAASLNRQGTFAEGSGACRRHPHRRRAAAWPSRRTADAGALVAVPRIAQQIQEERAMRPPRKTFVAAPVIVGVMATCIPHAAAQLTVFDPANYQENLLSSARALEQINNQVRQLQAQAQMIWRLDQNLLRLGTTISPGSAARARRHPSPAARRRWHRLAPAGNTKRLRPPVPARGVRLAHERRCAAQRQEPMG